MRSTYFWWPTIGVAAVHADMRAYRSRIRWWSDRWLVAPTAWPRHVYWILPEHSPSAAHSSNSTCPVPGRWCDDIRIDAPAGWSMAHSSRSDWVQHQRCHHSCAGCDCATHSGPESVPWRIESRLLLFLDKIETLRLIYLQLSNWAAQRRYLNGYLLRITSDEWRKKYSMLTWIVIHTTEENTKLRPQVTDGSRVRHQVIYRKSLVKWKMVESCDYLLFIIYFSPLKLAISPAITIKMMMISVKGYLRFSIGTAFSAHKVFVFDWVIIRIGRVVREVASAWWTPQVTPW